MANPPLSNKKTMLKLIVLLTLLMFVATVFLMSNYPLNQLTTPVQKTSSNENILDLSNFSTNYNISENLNIRPPMTPRLKPSPDGSLAIDNSALPSGQTEWWSIDVWSTPLGSQFPPKMNGTFVAVSNTIGGLNSKNGDCVIYEPINVAYGTSSSNCVWFQFVVYFFANGGSPAWSIWDFPPGANGTSNTIPSSAYVPGHTYNFALTESNNYVTFSIQDVTTSAWFWSWGITVPGGSMLYWTPGGEYSPASCVEGYTTNNQLINVPEFTTTIGYGETTHFYSDSSGMPSGIGTQVLGGPTYYSWAMIGSRATYLFSDGFESGSLNSWNSLYGTFYLNSQTVNSGYCSVESMIAGNNQNLYYHTLGNEPSQTDVREYIYINSTNIPSTSGDYYQVGGFASSSGANYGAGEICVFNVAGRLYWGIYYRDLSSPTGFSHSISNDNATYDANPVSIGWNCVELAQTTGTSGAEQLYLNGVSIIGVTVNNSDRIPFSVTIGGSQSVANPNNKWNYYIDDVVVSNGFIGPILYSLTTSTNYGTITPENGPKNSGSNILITAIPPSNVQGERYVFLGWGGTGIGSYTGSMNPILVNMTDDITETAVWDHQFYLNVTSNQGSPSPSSGWFDNGTNITDYVISPILGGAGTQYVCSGWSGTGSVPASGNTTIANLTINAPSTILWNWTPQYYLNVNSVYGNPSGQGWYNNGSTAYAGLDSGNITLGIGTQCTFSSWNVGGTKYNQSNAIIMNAPQTAIASWKTQYYLNVTSAYGNATGSGWYDAGTSATATSGSLTSPLATGIQYAFISWGTDASGSGSTSNNIIMNSPKTATATWIIQYQLTFTVSPSGTGSTTPAGSNLWVNSGPLPISVTPNSGYSFSQWSSQNGFITFDNPNSSSAIANVTGPDTIIATLTLTPIPTPTPTPIPTPTPTPSPTATPTPTPVPSPSPSPTQTVTPIPSSTPTPMVSPTLTSTPSSTSAPTQTQVDTLTPTPTTKIVPTSTATATPIIPQGAIYGIVALVAIVAIVSVVLTLNIMGRSKAKKFNNIETKP
jgi:hypothetical protein